MKLAPCARRGPINNIGFRVEMLRVSIALHRSFACQQVEALAYDQLVTLFYNRFIIPIFCLAFLP